MSDFDAAVRAIRDAATRVAEIAGHDDRRDAFMFAGDLIHAGDEDSDVIRRALWITEGMATGYAQACAVSEGKKVVTVHLGARPLDNGIAMFEFEADPDDVFAGVVLRSVVAALGKSARKPRLHAALRAAIPVMRRYIWEYLESSTVKRDPNTISPCEWDEIAPDILALRMAQACVGDQPDSAVVDTDWLNDALDMSLRHVHAPEDDE